MSEQVEEKWIEPNFRFWDKLVTERGEGWKAFWGSEQSLTSRFDVFINHFPLNGVSVIDIGCGFGDFWGYANSKGIVFARYLGLDIHQRMIEGAKRNHPKAEFKLLNVLEQDPPFRPDYIVASGITTAKLENYEGYIELIFRRFNEFCTKGFAINFLSTQSQKPDTISQYFDPAWTLTLLQKTVGWRCNLIHDYKPNYFTILSFKEQ